MSDCLAMPPGGASEAEFTQKEAPTKAGAKWSTLHYQNFRLPYPCGHPSPAGCALAAGCGSTFGASGLAAAFGGGGGVAAVVLGPRSCLRSGRPNWCQV